MLTVEGDIADPATADRIIGGALETVRPRSTPWSTTPASSSPSRSPTTPPGTTHLVVGVNLTGFFWLTQRVIAEMLNQGGGHVVNITTTLVDYANSSVPSVLTSLTKGGLAVGDQVAGRRVRVPGHPGQRRLAGHHPDAGAPGGEL